MALSDAFLEELRSRADIETTVSSYVTLKRKGRLLVGLCPFHNEKTPSFTVYPETQSYYCFGCGNGGDVVTFIRHIENLDYMEAVRFLADRHDLTVPQDGYDAGLSKKRALIYAANREAARFFHAALYSPEGKRALEYLHGRGIGDAAIRKFGLGCAPDSWNALLRYLRGKGCSEQLLYEANLVRMSTGNGSRHAYDAFKNRVMFPVLDLRGNVVAFSGRALDKSEPKYLNTQNTLVYKKGSSIFALNFAKKSKSGRLILCEGNMDVVSLHQAGFDNAVAGLGTALTAEQAKLLSRYTEEVLLCYDSDKPGMEATRKALALLGKTTMKVRVIRIEGGKDPDEIIQTYGAERFRSLIAGAANDTEYRLACERERFDLETPAGKTEFLSAASEVLATIESPIELDIYISKLAGEFGVNREAIVQQVKKLRSAISRKAERQRFAGIERAATDPREPLNRVNPLRAKHLRAAKAEETLIVSLFGEPSLLEKLGDELSPELFLTDFSRRVFSALAQRIREGRPMGLTFMAGDFTDEELRALSKLLTASMQVSDTLRECRDCIKVLRREKDKFVDTRPSEMSDTDFLKLFKNT